MAGEHIIERTRTIDRPLDEVFAFFSRAENLEALTPPWVNFKILTPTPIEMREGAIIDYRLKVRAMPIRWRTRIEVWDPPHRFVDLQIRGPYRLWHHTHTFESRHGGTVVHDRVRYRAPGWLLEPVVNALFVRRDIERIFDYRHAALDASFASAPEPAIAR